ncbi:uncharacterized protein C8A04DRAFT_26476 [Dichotomopilus funicola]|uniref:FAD-binding PCMH-type domain-containing protein n=1 Tax=Dichotomopilus funicola TaxID=1934379 RepID=A0AAN6ZQR8_9PEZI|nr:hypothetical protein C8A04DRAFT_26476 [Dichotomopilus funicola]
MALSRSLLLALQLVSPVFTAAAAAVTAASGEQKLSITIGNDHTRHSSCKASCKAVPGTPDWPSTKEWDSLNESLAGRLLQPTPPGAVCHSGPGAFDSAECKVVRDGWSTYDYHQADPVSVDWNQWANDTCLPVDGAPCSGQGYPVYVVNVTEARHAQLGVQFAKKHNIRIIVKSSGHDFLGRSTSPNSLSLWVHHLRGLQTHDTFQPAGCSFTIDHTSVTVGGGMQMGELYDALDSIGQTVVGGGAKSVAVGGYVSGAGHSVLSSTHGLAADQVLEIEAVTPDGEIVTANECQNQDLFWALRGGGASTFGVMTSVTMKTYPTMKIDATTNIIITPDLENTRVTFDMIAYVLSQLPDMGDKGMSGYSYVFQQYPNPLDDGNTTIAGFVMSAALQNQSPEALQQLWAPVFEHVNTTWPNHFTAIQLPESFTSFSDWYSKHYDTTPTGSDFYIGSRLLDREALTANLTHSAEAWKGFTGGSVSTAYLVSGKGVHNAKPRGGSNAVLPAWRKAYIHATMGEEAEPSNTTSRAIVKKRVSDRVAALRELAPDSGAYMNEAFYEEPDWQHTFWGPNYERLLAIKRRIDPHDVFWCTPCVGNERWEQVDDRLCRVNGR